MRFRTSILDHVTSDYIKRAHKKAYAALAQLNAVLEDEVFSPTVRNLIMDAAEEYASARQKIMEAKVGEEASQYVEKDMQMMAQMKAMAESLCGILEDESPVTGKDIAFFKKDPTFGL